jgi:hypothetical protein
MSWGTPRKIIHFRLELSIINLINHRFWMILGYPHDYGNLHISNHQISGPADGEITGWRRFVSRGMIRVLMLSMTSECLPSKKQQIATISIGYGSIPIKPIFSGMHIQLPAILGFTRYQGFDPSPNSNNLNSHH